jgi:hypothetical protein
MADANVFRRSISTTGTVTVRQRPSLLLMKVRLRATEPTLELGLAKLKAQCEAASQWLRRLGADRVEFGEPHFDDQTDKDPVTKMRVVAARAMGKHLGAAAPAPRQRGVNVVATAVWPIEALSADETLVLLDRLRFEAAEDAGPAEAAEEPPPSWASPEEQMREMMARMQQPPEDDRTPQFLFVFRLAEEQAEKATAEAFSRAHRNAERLARAAGLRLGGLTSLHYSHGAGGENRPDKLMERQRCAALLAGSSYDLREHESVSDDPRPAEFIVSVTAGHWLEQPTPGPQSECDPPGERGASAP